MPIMRINIDLIKLCTMINWINLKNVMEFKKIIDNFNMYSKYWYAQNH